MTGKYSVIFLHDGGDTHRWRIGPALVRSLIFLGILIPVIAAASLWLNSRLWQELNALRADNQNLRRQLESSAQTTARLANLEQFLRKTDPQGLDDLLPSRSGAGSGAHSPAPAAPADKAQAQPDSGPEPAAEPPAKSAESADATESAGDSPPAPDAADGAPGAADSPDGVSSPEAASDPARARDPVDTGLVRVENLNARRIGARSLRISFDLYNTEQVSQVAGKATFELILADGSGYPLDDQGDTSYRINRLKKIVGNPTLPTEVSDTKDASILVNVLSDGKLIYRVITPLN
ncbi:MAG: hypothetical protein J1E80_02390 [Desulfovibrionaceae bacterium]|nr:hypothetical protein [Desulfovibrionaceae bacterium]